MKLLRRSKNMEGSEWLSVIIGLLHAGGHAEHSVSYFYGLHSLGSTDF